MEKYTKLDYEKAAYEYYLHNELLEDTVKLLDQVFSSSEVYTMKEHYVYQIATKEERKIYQSVMRVHGLQDYLTVMRTKNMSFEYAIKYLERRNIKVKQINVLLQKLDRYQQYIPEEYQYIETLAKKYNKETEKLQNQKELAMKIKEKEKMERIRKAVDFIEFYLSSANPIPVYDLHCEYTGIVQSEMTYNIAYLKRYEPELCARFEEFVAQENSKENIERLFQFINPIYKKAEQIVKEFEKEGETPDLIDYYENIKFPYPFLLKIMKRYYTKKENDILRSFHKQSIHSGRVIDSISDSIVINGVSFTSAEQYKILEWLQENNFPISYDIFRDKLLRIVKEKNKQKHL